jgi:hypothetical protein
LVNQPVVELPPGQVEPVSPSRFPKAPNLCANSGYAWSAGIAFVHSLLIRHGLSDLKPPFDLEATKGRVLEHLK